VAINVFVIVNLDINNDAY